MKKTSNIDTIVHIELVEGYITECWKYNPPYTRSFLGFFKKDYPAIISSWHGQYTVEEFGETYL